MSSAYHPETDGATERANRTVTQMLRQCVNDKQTDWVSKLPAIEFAINSARSDSTGYSPFFLNTGRLPRSMLFTLPIHNDEYPSVRNFAITRRLALMSAHDSILTSRVKQTRDANRKRRVEPFLVGDLVYVSTKNFAYPKGLACKLVPKYLGPYKILRDFNNHSFLIDLPPRLKARGLHNVFHSSLLRIHVPNDDRRFPGRSDDQLSQDETHTGEWAVERIISHVDSGTNSTFEIQWASGDVTWLPYDQISDLPALNTYLDLLGFDDISNLPKGNGEPPKNDPQAYLGTVSIKTYGRPDHKKVPKFRRILTKLSLPLRSCFHPHSSTFDSTDQSIILTDPIMDVDPPLASLTSPAVDPIKPVHPLIDLTPDGDFIVKSKPNDKSSASPRGQIYSKNIISDYVDHSLRCQEATRSRSLDAVINMRTRTSIRYPVFAKYYNANSADGNGRFTIYDKDIDTYMLVLPDISLTDFGIRSNNPVTPPISSNIEAGPSNNKKRPFNHKSRGPQDHFPKKSPSLTSILQQTHKLRGFDGLLADLLVTSASQHASCAKMGTLHFGIRHSKRNHQNSRKFRKDKNNHNGDSSSKSTTDLPLMEGVIAESSSSSST